MYFRADHENDCSRKLQWSYIRSVWILRQWSRLFPRSVGIQSWYSTFNVFTDKLDQAMQVVNSSTSKRSVERRQGPQPLPMSSDSDFSLPSSARNGLSNILIVHVIAAVLSIVTLILCLIAHVRKPSHSVRFLLAIFIIQILNTILTLLSFLVDLLVFVPHFAFGTWLVLAATVCNAIATGIYPPLLLYSLIDNSFTMLWTTNVNRS
jgi:hypothetical protein